MAAYDIRPISAAETRWLRHSVLRPHQSPESLVFPGDDAPDSLHLGAFHQDKLVGIVSVSRQPFPGEPGQPAWQLQGMAALPEVQGQGYGAALVGACLEYIMAQGGGIIWCNGRSGVLPFYQKLGFQSWGEEFHTPVTGPHYLLWRMCQAEGG